MTHPKPWTAAPLWKSTDSPWAVRDGSRHKSVFLIVDDEATARWIVAQSERES